MLRLRTRPAGIRTVLMPPVVCAWLILALFSASAVAEILAFPGAEGEGRLTSGGRGGDVYHVSNLNDSGAGSLRNGLLTASGPRTIVFDVGGTIALNSDLYITNPNVTIAGQTAPGDGVVITQYGLAVHASNVIMRHMRFRPGDARKGPAAQGGFSEDAVSIRRSDVILDHVSTSWGIDENLSVGGNGTRRVTVQYSTISEGLDQTGLYHGEWNFDFNPGGSGHHSHGSLIKPDDGNGIVSFHHNLWSNNYNRNPAVGTYDTDQTLKADIRNNVMYNNRANGYSSGASERIDMNYVGNYIIAGPETNSSFTYRAFDARVDNNMRIYQFGNKIDGYQNGTLDGSDYGWSAIWGTYTQSATPFAMAPVTTDTADAAYQKVLAGAGAFPWNRDSVDQRLMDEIARQRGAIIDSQNEVGGYPVLPTSGRPVNWDTDGDGMPDYWEWMNFGLIPLLADNNGDLDGDGYTNLEEYLAYAATPEPSAIAILLPALLPLVRCLLRRRVRKAQA